MTVDELEAKYEARGERRGGILLLSSQDSIDFINEASKNKLKILGIDAFRISSKEIQPILDFSNDESHFKGSQSAFIQFTQELIATADRKIMFEIVISD